MSELDQRRQALASSGLNDLVDGIYQSQLATEEGIAVTDADVEQSLTEEVAGVEQRHVARDRSRGRGGRRGGRPDLR